MKTFLLLMQLFTANGQTVEVKPLEETTQLVGCDYHYSMGMEIGTCLHKRHVVMYIGTTPEFFAIQNEAVKIAIKTGVPY